MTKQILNTLYAKAKNIKLPGLDNVALFDLGTFFYKGVSRGAITNRASSLSFNFFLALFPGIIFLFTLIPYILGKNFQEQLLGIIQDILPANAYKASKSTINDIVRHQRGGLLSLSFLFALYFSTNGINAIINAFNHSYHVPNKRSFLQQRVVAVSITFILSILLLVSISLMVFTEFMLKYFMQFDFVKDQWLLHAVNFGKWGIILLMFYIGISCLYYFGPAGRHRWKFFSAGSTVATILTVLVSLGFTYFVNNFGQYNKVYGSIGTLIVILLWIYFNSIILLVGFELNASILVYKHNKHDIKPIAHFTGNKPKQVQPK